MADPDPCIEDYALLSDGHSAALVSRQGSIDWWSPERFDAPTVFGRLLDSHAGHWTIAPTEAHDVERRYEDGTLVLRTTFRTDGGQVTVRDALALEHRARGHDIGARSPHRVLRSVEGEHGRVRLRMRLEVRADYGRHAGVPRRGADGIELPTGDGALHLHAPVPIETDDGGVTSEFDVDAGDRVAFSLAANPGASPGAASALEDTVIAWRSWSSEHDRYHGFSAPAVHQSSLVLQGLTYRPTGAIVAAPTTSLPAILGGGDNWDYRYAWLRDASFTLNALWVGACPDESEAYVRWMTHAVGDDGADDRLQVVYAVDGRRDLTERTLDHLAGYAGSRPVRVGNDAWRQSQLDVPGEVLDAAFQLRDRLDPLSPQLKEFLIQLAERTEEHWRDADAGIWEGREGDKQYVTSKLLCWVALDRAIGLAPLLGCADRVAAWSSSRDAIRAAILEKGWSEKRKSFTGAFESENLDAGVLLIPLVGFLPGDDPRVGSTVDAVEAELADDGLVHRWTGAEDGAFVMCSYWLAACRAVLGDTEAAQHVFERVTSHANDVGLLSEEIDAPSGRLLGNFPQGLSHAALVHAAWTIDRTTEENP